MSGNKTPAVIIENGSWTIKAGLQGDNVPRVTFPTLAGSRKDAGENFDLILGQEVKDNYDDMCAHWIFDGTSCHDWDDMTSLWKHTYGKLKVDPSSSNVLTTVSFSTPKEVREKMIEIFFEKLNVPGCYIASDSALALYACGRVSGMVVDCGHTATNIVPMYEGFAIHEHATKLPFGGKSLTEYLASLISKKGIDLSTPSLRLFEATKIKETHCRVALEYEKEMASASTQKYTLPDGKTIELDKELIQSTECYFQPKVQDSNNGATGLPAMISDSVKMCDIDMRSDLVKNIILCGGSSLIPGLDKRLGKETKALNTNAKVISVKDRQIFTFAGASVLTDLPAMEKQWVTKAEFAEDGACIVHKKCV